MSAKQQMIEALRAFIAQRSGIDYRNYDCGDWKRTRECFNGDYRPMLRHGRQARAMLAAVELCDGISAEDLKEATRAYSGRLQFVERDGRIAVDYCPGQYFPTEYRAAACAVLASALWAHFRKLMPEPTGKVMRSHGPFTTEHESYGGLSAGEYLRREAQRRFGPGIAKTWFN